MIPKQNTPDWYEWRRGGIGASDVPAIVGEDPFRGEYELALLKRGELEPEPESHVMRWGHLVEPLGLRLYDEATGRRTRHIGTTVLSKEYPHVFASLDGRVVGERRGVEVKWTRSWDEPPRRVLIQCQVQMAVCRLEAIDVVRLNAYSEPTITTVEYDPDLAAGLCGLAEAWYVRYVLGDEMPPIDGSRGASRALDRERGPEAMVADEEQAGLVRQLHDLRERIRADSDLERLLVNRIKQSMGGAEALRGDGFRISWKRAKPREAVDWQAVAADLATPESEAWRAAVGAHTTTKEGSRPFRLTVEGQSDDE